MKIEIKNKDWQWIICLIIVIALIAAGQLTGAVDFFLKFGGK